MSQYSDHVSLVELIEHGFLEQVQIEYDPAREKYGAYLVHYSGWEDPWRALTDIQLKEKIEMIFWKNLICIGVSYQK